ncbi:MAG: hypothetical protein V8S81_01570 [Oscillospiraceae bacterium]
MKCEIIIDGADFRQMVIHAAAAINMQKQAINDLNVFPVPDGDTGTNMSLTIGTAAAELSRNQPEHRRGGRVDRRRRAFAGRPRQFRRDSLLLFRGFAKALKEKSDQRQRFCHCPGFRRARCL